MARKGGRKPGRALSELELRHLRLLMEVRERAQTYARLYDEQLEDFILECRENGASVRGLAEQLGVGSSTIQTWTNSARKRRKSTALGKHASEGFPAPLDPRSRKGAA